MNAQSSTQDANVPISSKFHCATRPRSIHTRHVKRRLDPLHLSFLIFRGRTRESSLEHSRHTDRTGIVSSKNECMLQRAGKVLFDNVRASDQDQVSSKAERRRTVGTLSRPTMISFPSRTIVWNFTTRASGSIVVGDTVDDT